ncbi:MAG TPA: hypothetical protein PK671_12930, partial [Candidatus Obscuribacter sp.]|nr:hypothetical protein [Candidatus Obscuribacter sp.]
SDAASRRATGWALPSRRQALTRGTKGKQNGLTVVGAQPVNLKNSGESREVRLTTLKRSENE